MSPMPEGWSVDVEGTRVVLRADLNSGGAASAADVHTTTEGQTAAVLPLGWSTWPDGRNVRLEIPASAADGDFELSRSNAAVVGFVLLWLSMPPSLREDLVDSETVSAYRSGQYRVISPDEWAELSTRTGTNSPTTRSVNDDRRPSV